MEQRRVTVETSMNSLEAFNAAFGGPAANLWVAAVSVLLALCALAVSLRLARRHARDRARLDCMRRDLQAFTEASTRVADTLDHLLTGTVEPAEPCAPSRRYLLLRAREGMQNGETLEALSERLDLCEDERKLLEFAQTGTATATGSAAPPRAPGRRAWVA